MLSTLLAPAEALATALVQPCTPYPEGPAEEGYTLLGRAWRSPTPALVLTGENVDLVRVPEAHGRHVLHCLQLLDVRRGAVFSDHGAWHFFVPLGSGMDWPEAVTYLSGQQVVIPDRGARANGQQPLHWITRHPPGQLLTAPIPLWAALCAVAADGGRTLAHLTPSALPNAASVACPRRNRHSMKGHDA